MKFHPVNETNRRDLGSINRPWPPTPSWRADLATLHLFQGFQKLSGINPFSRSCVELVLLVDVDVSFLPAHGGLRAASGFSAVRSILLVPSTDRR